MNIISESRLTNICRHTTYVTSSGHIVSPKFPDVYPNRRNCTCAVSAPAGSRMLVGTAFLLVKNDEPCRDWLSLRVDSAPEVRRCGFIPHSRHMLGNTAIINFRSDKTDRDMGFWAYFRGKRQDFDTVEEEIRNLCGTSVTSSRLSQFYPTNLHQRRLTQPAALTRLGVLRSTARTTQRVLA